jgi:hypothetical protein
MTVDLSSGIDRHYMAKLNCVSRYPGRDLFSYRSHRICNCIRLHQTASDCIHVCSVQPYSYTAFSLDTLMLYETINQCITSVISSEKRPGVISNLVLGTEYREYPY